MDRKHNGLHLNDDPVEMTNAIKAFERAAIDVERPNRYVLKCRKFNYWPSRGTFYIDGEKAAQKKVELAKVIEDISDYLKGPGRYHGQIVDL